MLTDGEGLSVAAGECVTVVDAEAVTRAAAEDDAEDDTDVVMVAGGADAGMEVVGLPDDVAELDPTPEHEEVRLTVDVRLGAEDVDAVDVVLGVDVRLGDEEMDGVGVDVSLAVTEMEAVAVVDSELDGVVVSDGVGVGDALGSGLHTPGAVSDKLYPLAHGADNSYTCVDEPLVTNRVPSPVSDDPIPNAAEKNQLPREVPNSIETQVENTGMDVYGADTCTEVSTPVIGGEVPTTMNPPSISTTSYGDAMRGLMKDVQPAMGAGPVDGVVHPAMATALYRYTPPWFPTPEA